MNQQLPFNPWILVLAPVAATMIQKLKYTYAYDAVSERIGDLSKWLSVLVSALTSAGLVAVTMTGSAALGWEFVIKVPPVAELGQLLANLVLMHMGQAATYHAVIQPREERTRKLANIRMERRFKLANGKPMEQAAGNQSVKGQDHTSSSPSQRGIPGM